MGDNMEGYIRLEGLGVRGFRGERTVNALNL